MKAGRGGRRHCSAGRRHAIGGPAPRRTFPHQDADCAPRKVNGSVFSAA
ncbi:hypothetical protein SERN_2084 [Serinibacter arcticus]|uniref:Uncharacterized protein n=1 Tax=Serinibacter arcticus TaxID=1655435 RepID=A0A4Z1E4D0_9MICO|nr:hypothetical protein SERN_2084 [Serinibacter arcticus]